VFTQGLHFKCEVVEDRRHPAHPCLMEGFEFVILGFHKVEGWVPHESGNHQLE
jgi:hypothetical protein